MWIFTTDGFISCVRQGDKIAVRARERSTLEALATRVSGHPSEAAEQLADIKTTTDTDYRYRVHLDRVHFGALILELALSVDYPNFKNAVREKQGESLYEKALHKVWTVMGKTQPGGPYGWGGIDYPPVPKGEPRSAMSRRSR